MNERDPMPREGQPREDRPRPVRRAVRRPDQLKNTYASQQPTRDSAPQQPTRSAAPPARDPAPRQPRGPAAAPARRPAPTQPAPVRSAAQQKSRKKKKKKPVFYIVLFSLFFLLFVGLLVGLMVLKSVLTAYEDAQPVHQAEKVFEEYFAGRDFEKVVAAAGVKPGDYETPAEIAALMKSVANGKELIYYPVASGENEARYAVSVVDELPKDEVSTDPLAVQTIRPTAKLATMVFTKNETAGKYGFVGYTFSHITLEMAGRRTFSARVPGSYTLFVNGREVPKEDRTGETASPLNDFLDEGVPGIWFYEYSMSGLFVEPVISCADAAGNPVELQLEEGVYTAPLQYSEALKEAHTDLVLAGIRAYMSRMSNDGGLGAVNRYFDISSEYYKQIRDNPSIFVWDHNGQTFTEQSADDFYGFDENTFCCRVRTVQHLHMYGREDYVEHFDEILFVHKCSDGTWGIYDHVKPEVVGNV